MCDELQKYPEACNILQNNNGFLFRLLKDLLQEFRERQAGNAADDVVNKVVDHDGNGTIPACGPVI